MPATGPARKGKSTKRLCPLLLPGDVAVVSHRDIDRVSAEMLVKAEVRAVVNAEPSMSGEYPNWAPLTILKAKIPIVDLDDPADFDSIEEGIEVEVHDDGSIVQNGQTVAKGTPLRAEQVEQAAEAATSKVDAELERFVLNTAEYLRRDNGHIIYNPNVPSIDTQLKDKQVLVVVRGPGYKDDLNTLRSYIREFKPVIVAVDGGADAVVEAGLEPDIVVGDMDSVSDDTLRQAPEVIAHAYEDGSCPSAERLDELGVSYKVWPLAATSEDLALLLAWEYDADLIVAVGTHSNLVEYMEKGREGMASTFLVRLRVGTKLVDAKGVSKLYRPAPPERYVLIVIAAALITMLAVIFVSEPLRNTLMVMWLTLLTNLGI